MKIRFILILLVLTILIAAFPVFAQQDSIRTSVRKINPTLVLFRSALVPGWGQFYNKRFIKGTLIYSGESYLIINIIRDWREANRYKAHFQRIGDPIFKDQHKFPLTPLKLNKQPTDYSAYRASEFSKYQHARDRRNIKMWLLVATVFYSMFDAYVDAQLSDFNQIDKAYEVYLAPAHDDGFQLMVNFKFR
jgi:hypothetical protein